MGLPLLPDPLATAELTLEEIGRLEQEIAELERQLGRLRRIKGLRLMQLKEFDPQPLPATPSSPGKRSFIQAIARWLKSKLPER